jgi:hypothetical protein
MSDQATNERAVADHIQLGVVEIARLSPTSTSEELLRRIATLLFMLVAGLLTVFAYYASSLCITVVRVRCAWPQPLRKSHELR